MKLSSKDNGEEDVLVLVRPSQFASDRDWAEALDEKAWLAEERAREAEDALEQVDGALGGWRAKREINLGPDFPLTDEARERRERLAEVLENALHCARYDPIGGNVRHCVENALQIMGKGDGKGAA